MAIIVLEQNDSFTAGKYGAAIIGYTTGTQDVSIERADGTFRRGTSATAGADIDFYQHVLQPIGLNEGETVYHLGSATQSITIEV